MTNDLTLKFADWCRDAGVEEVHAVQLQKLIDEIEDEAFARGRRAERNTQ